MKNKYNVAASSGYLDRIVRHFQAGSVKKRWRIPIWAAWATPYIPQPRFLRRWYYAKSFQWWEHPSNHHWKGWLIGEGRTLLLPGERDLWTGCYCQGESESLPNTKATND